VPGHRGTPARSALDLVTFDLDWHDVPMHQVVARLDALDPEAGAAIRVIGRFDELLEGRAGLEPVLAAVAVLTGSPARLIEPRYGLALRANTDGQVERELGPADPR
jgi:hypothetical protein